ncbi:hypothetical protein HKX48_001159 [Thoreauomyces humboldtii]|nr:hypothetical protein HKX48_001159 [Thoreauomyces humboldtii]
MKGPIGFSLCIIMSVFGVASYVEASATWLDEERRRNLSTLAAIVESGRIYGRVLGSLVLEVLDIPDFIDDARSSPPSLGIPYCIVAANCIIFLLWQFPSRQTFMRRHFIHDTESGRFYTLLTSAFSHESMSYLAANMRSRGPGTTRLASSLTEMAAQFRGL